MTDRQDQHIESPHRRLKKQKEWSRERARCTIGETDKNQHITFLGHSMSFFRVILSVCMFVHHFWGPWPISTLVELVFTFQAVYLELRFTKIILNIILVQPLTVTCSDLHLICDLSTYTTKRFHNCLVCILWNGEIGWIDINTQLGFQ